MQMQGADKQMATSPQAQVTLANNPYLKSTQTQVSSNHGYLKVPGKS